VFPALFYAREKASAHPSFNACTVSQIAFDWRPIDNALDHFLIWGCRNF
jgi:hypothetical protein